MALKAAYVFVAPEVDPKKHRHTILTPAVELTAVAVNNYAEAVQVCRELLKEGITAFELCGGFGNIGTGIVAEALKSRAKPRLASFDSMIIPALKAKVVTIF